MMPGVVIHRFQSFFFFVVGTLGESFSLIFFHLFSFLYHSFLICLLNTEHYYVEYILLNSNDYSNYFYSSVDFRLFSAMGGSTGELREELVT